MAYECPECHADLEPLAAEEVRAHSLDHWPEDIDPRAAHKDAIERQGQLSELFEQKRADERNQQRQPDAYKGGY